HYRTGGNRNFLAGLGVAARALVLAPQVEIAKTGQLHLPSLFQRVTQHIEECVDKLLGLTLVQTDFVEQTIRHLRLCQCHTSSLCAASTTDLCAVPAINGSHHLGDHGLDVA